jgi:hypothetical protein
MNAAEAAGIIVDNSLAACKRLNDFTSKAFKTRGGRIGSGMGGVIEALWGFSLNEILIESEAPEHAIELAWMYGHEYNDFACIERGVVWNPETRDGELLRVEVKSMVASADESKAHFDRLQKELTDTDLLAVFLWDWIPVPETGDTQHFRVSPQIKGHFVGSALDVAKLRDALHLARGGNFVIAGQCPDGCSPAACSHVGEPLNASGIRERLSGPASRRGKSVSYAANFGGLVRMLGCANAQARRVFQEHYVNNESAREYVDFLAGNFSRIRRSLPL